MNIIEHQEMLKDLSDNDIAREMQQPSGNVPLYLVAGEAKRRADLRERFKAEQAGPAPTSTVQEDLLNSIMASQMPATGIAQGVRPQAPPPQQMAQVGGPPLDPNMPAIAPNPNMPAIAPTGEALVNRIPQAQGIMAGQQGDMVRRLAGGGLVREDRKYQNPQGPVQAIYTNPWTPGGVFSSPSAVVRDSSGAIAFADLKARKRQEALERRAKVKREAFDKEITPAMAYLYRNTDMDSDFSMGDPREGATNLSYENYKIMNDPAHNDWDLGSEDYDPALFAPIDNSFVGPPRPTRNQIIKDRNDLARVGILEENKKLAGLRSDLTKQQLATKLEPGKGKIPQRGTASFNPTKFEAGDAPTAAKLGALKTAEPMNAGTKLDTSLDGAVRRETILAKLRGEAPKPYEAMRKALIERRATLAEDKDGNTAQTLMDLGGRIMAGKSQYGLTNIGEAVSPALKAAQERKAGQTAREDALIASEMGIISGERTMDQDLQRQADKLVGYEQKKQDDINTEIVRKNAEARTVYLDRVRDVGEENARKELIATTTNTFAKYNDTRQLNIQKTIYDREFNNYQVQDKALDNAFQNGVITDRKDYERRKDKLAQEIRINAITRQSINDAQIQINRKEDIINKSENKLSDQEFTLTRDEIREQGLNSRLDENIAAKKNLAETAVKIKNINAQSKIARDAWTKATEFYIKDNGQLPDKDDVKGWERIADNYKAGLANSGYGPSVKKALIRDKIAQSRGGSGSPPRGKQVKIRNKSGAKKLTQ